MDVVTHRDSLLFQELGEGLRECFFCVCCSEFLSLVGWSTETELDSGLSQYLSLLIFAATDGAWGFRLYLIEHSAGYISAVIQLTKVSLE